MNNYSETDNVLIYSKLTSPRLSYITSLIFNDIIGLKVNITTKVDDFVNFKGAKINYSIENFKDKNVLKIASTYLLFEKGVSSQNINSTLFFDYPAIFSVFCNDSSLPFDIFAASFFLVSRYEEYLPYIKDEHNRFSAKSSIACQKKFLKIPLINVWVKYFKQILLEKYPFLKINKNSFKFEPTFDIDAAWAFKHKGFYRTIGGVVKDLKCRNIERLKERFNVLIDKINDPFDTFEFIKNVHEKYSLKPIFFILFANYSKFDKNIDIRNRHFIQLVRQLSDYAFIGIHPSYQSNSNSFILKSEINALSETIHCNITKSRQHFIKLHLPETYKNLINNDITDDYSMGYASLPGFRASICTPFKWYDIETESETNLIIHPFAFMDGTFNDYLKLDKKQAFDQIKELIKIVKSVDGVFSTLWHNESVSDYGRWKNWRELYINMVEEIIKN